MAQPRNRSADARLDVLPNAVLECRDLRHAWPRSNAPTNKMVATKFRGGRVVEATRHMECEGGCGTVREEDFYVYGDGRTQRVGAPRYRYGDGYLIKHEPGVEHERVDPDVLRFTVLSRLYPNLKW